MLLSFVQTLDCFQHELWSRHIPITWSKCEHSDNRRRTRTLISSATKSGIATAADRTQQSPSMRSTRLLRSRSLSRQVVDYQISSAINGSTIIFMHIVSQTESIFRNPVRVCSCVSCTLLMEDSNPLQEPIKSQAFQGLCLNNSKL